MSRIYFDSNIYSYLRANSQPLYQQLNELLSLYKTNLTFFFSHAHIRDKKKDSTQHKFADFTFMESFTQDNYLSYHILRKNTSQYLATPLMAFNDEKDFGEEYLQYTPDTQAYKDVRKLIDEGINNGKFSLNSNNKLNFNEALKDSVLQKTFIEFVSDSTIKNEKGQALYYDFYSVAYHSLDLLGIKKDKLNDKNGYANLLNDGLHSYYARYCDYLITADDNLRKKSKALYSLFDVHTMVLSVEEFINLLPSIGRSTDENVFIFFEKLSSDIRETERTQTRIEDNREASALLIKNKYFNFFDFIMEVKEDGFTHYILRKLPDNILSAPNYREKGMIIDRCIPVLGYDLMQKGTFNFAKEVEEIENNTWLGRVWKVGSVVIFLQRNKALNEFCMMISPAGIMNLQSPEPSPNNEINRKVKKQSIFNVIKRIVRFFRKTS